jgi:hypothetical protein
MRYGLVSTSVTVIFQALFNLTVDQPHTRTNKRMFVFIDHAAFDE